MRNISEEGGPGTTSTDMVDRDETVAAPSSRPSRPRRRLSSGAILVALCALGALLAGAGWALSSPVGSSPDDDYHMTSIWCAADYDDPACEQVGTTDDGKPIVRVPALLTSAACFAGDSAASAECQDEVERMGDVDTDRVNSTDYPGGYYRVMHLFAGEDIPTSVILMRLVNVLLAVGLFTALSVCGTRATRRIQLYTLASALVPVGWYFIASVNPSGWAITGVTAFGFGLHSALVVASRRRLWANVVLAGVGATMALAARGDAAVYVGLVALAFVVLHWRTVLRRGRLLFLPGAAILAAAAVALTSGQVAGAATPEPETTRTGVEVFVSFVMSFPTLIGGSFGFGWALGWVDTYMPALTVAPALVAVGFLALSGAARWNPGKVLAALGLASVLVALPFLTLYRARLIVGEAVQPRYLLPLIPVLLLILLTGRRTNRGLRLTRPQAAVLWALVTVANCAALYTNTWRYVTGTDEATLLADVEWWWWTGWPTPLACWIISSVGFACFAAVVIGVSGTRQVRRASGHGDSRRPPTRLASTGSTSRTEGATS